MPLSTNIYASHWTAVPRRGTAEITHVLRVGRRVRARPFNRFSVNMLRISSMDVGRRSF